MGKVFFTKTSPSLIELVCPFCGRTFYKYPSAIKGHRFIYCSKQCKIDATSKTKNPDHYQEVRDNTIAAKNLSVWAKENNKIPLTKKKKENIAKGMVKVWDKNMKRKELKEKQLQL